jgi:hypothetical protein
VLKSWSPPAFARIPAPAVVGLFVIVAGAVVTHGSPYLDGPRDQLTAGFTAERLRGVSTLPSNATHVNDLVSEIERDTPSGEATFVFPDGQAYYVATGRTNPTKVDWYDLLATTPALSIEATDRLEHDRPQWIFVQRYNESDVRHLDPLDFESQAAWRPIYDFVVANYDLVRTVGDVQVYRLK